MCCDLSLGLRSAHVQVASGFCGVGGERLSNRCFEGVLAVVVASAADEGSSLPVVFVGMALSWLEHSSQGKAGIVVEVDNHVVVAAVAESMLNRTEEAYSHTQDYERLVAGNVAQVVVDIVAASVAEMNMGVVGDCLAVLAQPAFRGNILGPPSLVVFGDFLQRGLSLSGGENNGTTDGIRCMCWEMLQTVRDDKITRPWLDKYQERVHLSPVHTEYAVHTSFDQRIYFGLLSMQLGLSGELGKLVGARLTGGRPMAKSGEKRPRVSVAQ